MLDDRCFKEAYRFCTRLLVTLKPNGDQVVTFEDEKLCELLGSKYYTYLTLIGDCKHETVKVYPSQGLLFVERGIDDTYPQEWPCGSELSFEWTPSVLSDQMRKAMEQTPEEPECPEPYSGEFCMGRFNFVVRKGLIVECRPNGRNIANEEFVNPVISFDKNGCVECVKEGPDKFLQYREDCK